MKCLLKILLKFFNDIQHHNNNDNELLLPEIYHANKLLSKIKNEESNLKKAIEANSEYSIINKHILKIDKYYDELNSIYNEYPFIKYYIKK